jgi:hypothetical protein
VYKTLEKRMVNIVEKKQKKIILSGCVFWLVDWLFLTIWKVILYIRVQSE